MNGRSASPFANFSSDASLDRPLGSQRPTSDGERGEPIAKIGRRGAARLRLRVEARLITLYGTQRCLMVDISQTGAQILLEEPMHEGASGFLQFGSYEVFVSAVRRDDFCNGLVFDEGLSGQEILDIRAFAETHIVDHKRTLREEWRRWVAGEIR